MLKLNKNAKKGLLFRAGSRGCDVALRATWQHHASPRGKVTCAIIYIYILHTI